MGWASAHQEAMLLAAEAREDLGLDGFERVDVFEAIVATGLKLMFRPLQKVAGFYEPRRGSARAGVLVNSNHPLALQRYSAGHEYGHHLFDHGRQIDRATAPSFARGSHTAEEQRAEAFAAWFLMPPEAVATALERLALDRPRSEADAYALALRLGVSFKALCVHLPSLKLATRPVSERWFGTVLKSVKEYLTPDPPAGGWGHDVWVLREDDAASPLVVRCGDRLIFELPDAEPAHVPGPLQARELPPRDLLDRRRMCVDVPPSALPGPQQLGLTSDGRKLTYSLIIERPRRGRYLPKAAVAR